MSTNILHFCRGDYVLSGVHWDNLASEFYGHVLEGAAVSGDLGGSSPGDDEVTVEFIEEENRAGFAVAVRCFKKKPTIITDST